MKKFTGIKETQGVTHGHNNRGYWIGWKCPNCKYLSNDSIVVATDVQDFYKKTCDKCGEVITIKN